MSLYTIQVDDNAITKQITDILNTIVNREDEIEAEVLCFVALREMDGEDNA